MDDKSAHARFVAAADMCVSALVRRSEAPADGGDAARRVVNLGHQLSDTLPTELSERLESFLDGFWSLCERVWTETPDGEPLPLLPDPDLETRLDGLRRTWARLRTDLSPD